MASPLTHELTIPAADGYVLAATTFPAGPRWVVIGSATAVPRRFYRHIATFLQSRGFSVLTFDYRGIGGSRPQSLRGFEAYFRDWGALDIRGALLWVRAQMHEKVFLLGHSAGGQVAALAAEPVDAMYTVSSQSGYWGLQGGWQKLWVGLHMYLSFPLLSHLFGYMPWSKLGASEDLPKGVALEWARWCRDPQYLYGDKTLPLHLYEEFESPVMAVSIADDDWGTAASVDSMMGHYPALERVHLDLDRKIGHFGFFRPDCEDLWSGVSDFYNRF